MENPTSCALSTISETDLRSAVATLTRIPDSDRLRSLPDLPDEGALRRVVALGEARCEPMPADEAVACAKTLLGAYRAADLHDPAVFAAHATACFARYPADIGRAVAMELPRSLKWTPTVAEIEQALAGRLAQRKAVLYRAKQALCEHQRRRDEEARDKRMSGLAADERAARVAALIGDAAPRGR